MCIRKQAPETETHLQEYKIRRLWVCNAHKNKLCIYACTDCDLQIKYKCVNFCEINMQL